MNKVIFNAVPVSDGIGTGVIYAFKRIPFMINRGVVKEKKIQDEIDKLDSAIGITLSEVYDLKHDFGIKLDEKKREIFDVYFAILKDRYFINEIKNKIYNQKIFAENAVYTCIQEYIKKTGNSNNEYMKQRIYDLDDIRTRIIKNIVGGRNINLSDINSKKIILIKVITPSIAVMLGKKKISGLAVEEGAGYWSHASIILRGLGIPVINNIIYEEVKKYTNKAAIINGTKGFLIIDTDKNMVKKQIKIWRNTYKKAEKELRNLEEPVMTKDGHKLNLFVTVNTMKELGALKNRYFDGIGLVRTEFLFINNGQMPSESSQFRVYSRIVREFSDKPVFFRTADVRSDKMSAYMSIALDLRTQNLTGIRYSLAQERQFLMQIRPIVRTSRFGNVSIMFPMVNNAEEVEKAVSLVNKAVSDLQREGKKFLKNINIGAVIETKYAVENIDEILELVDFICIGTNDLFQQTTGLNRENSLREKDNYLCIDFLETIRCCVNKANQKSKFVSVCGEIITEPAVLIALAGMGVKNFSICPAKYLAVTNLIREINLGEVKSIIDSQTNSNLIERIKKILSGLEKGWDKKGT